MERRQNCPGWTSIVGGLILSLVLATGLRITPALAHGAAELSVSPADAAPGDTITVSADGVEAGEVFTITLEGVNYQATLGTVTVTGDGFEQKFTLPKDVPAGSFQVRATSAEGEQIAADLSVITSTETQAVATPTGAEMSLDRGKSPGQLAVVMMGLVVSGAIGLILVRRRE